MYINEIMSYRYDRPRLQYPNEGTDKYEGMIVIRPNLKSVCSHHFNRNRYGIYWYYSNGKVIGYQIYRIAQWCARRGTLQEQLCNDIASEIRKATGASDVGVYSTYSWLL